MHLQRSESINLGTRNRADLKSRPRSEPNFPSECEFATHAVRRETMAESPEGAQREAEAESPGGAQREVVTESPGGAQREVVTESPDVALREDVARSPDKLVRPARKRKRNWDQTLTGMVRVCLGIAFPAVFGITVFSWHTVGDDPSSKDDSLCDSDAKSVVKKASMLALVSMVGGVSVSRTPACSD